LVILALDHGMTISGEHVVAIRVVITGEYAVKIAGERHGDRM